jgi:hypothetical protein
MNIDKKQQFGINFEMSKSKLTSIYELLGANTPLEMHRLYSEEDQKLMKSSQWDYDNKNLITNKVKTLLEEINSKDLTDDEAHWRNEVLWFWYHHAISCAIFNKGDKAAAEKYSEQALSLQSSEHPNYITKLLYFLVRGDINEAEKQAANIKDEPEKSSAAALIDEYKFLGGYFETTKTLDELEELDLTNEARDESNAKISETFNLRTDAVKKDRDDVMRLLGLKIKFRQFSDTQKKEYLISDERIKAFEDISTTTLPSKEKANQKRGIISELIQDKIISDEVLKNYKTVYLGSGTDIEYPLALGCRHTVMVDYIFNSPEAKKELIEKLQSLINKDVTLINNNINFRFDFGSGNEDATIELSPTMYLSGHHKQTGSVDIFKAPDNVGVIICYASQGPGGAISVGEDLKSKLVDSGVLLDNLQVYRFNQNDMTFGCKTLGTDVN